MSQYEARYYVSTDKFSACIGRQGNSTPYTPGEIINKQAQPLIDELTLSIDDFLFINPHMRPENSEACKVYVFIQPDINNRININFWVSNKPPSVSLVYDGIKKMSNPQSVIEAHTWELNLGAPFTYYKEHADKYINSFIEQKKNFPDNNFLTLHMFQEDIYYPPYLYGHFREMVNLKPYYTEALKKCPEDYHPVEIGYLTRGWFVWVKKTAWNTGSVTLNDILFYT